MTILKLSSESKSECPAEQGLCQETGCVRNPDMKKTAGNSKDEPLKTKPWKQTALRKQPHLLAQGHRAH